MKEARSLIVEIETEEQMRALIKESKYVVVVLFDRLSSFDVPFIRVFIEVEKEFSEHAGQAGFSFAKTYIGTDQAGNSLWDEANLSSSASFVLTKNGEIEDSFSAYMHEEDGVKHQFFSWLLNAAAELEQTS